MKQQIIGMVCLLLMVAAGAHAASHWTVNPHAYQYDMTVYVQLNAPMQTGYEVAAFCGTECRGVGVLLTADDGTQVFQLRVRSNEAVGEEISLRVYHAGTGKEYYPDITVDFTSQSVVGTPSEPLVLIVNTVLKGDVNGDGTVDIADAVAVVNHVVGKANTSFVEQAADVNGDGVVNIADVVRIVNLVLGKNDALAPRFEVNLPESQ